MVAWNFKLISGQSELVYFVTDGRLRKSNPGGNLDVRGNFSGTHFSSLALSIRCLKNVSTIFLKTINCCCNTVLCGHTI
jgi:hypothetical protein